MLGLRQSNSQTGVQGLFVVSIFSGGSGGLQAGVISPGQSWSVALMVFFKSEGEQQAC